MKVYVPEKGDILRAKVEGQVYTIMVVDTVDKKLENQWMVAYDTGNGQRFKSEKQLSRWLRLWKFKPIGKLSGFFRGTK